MGTLKPGAMYTYERENNVVYARESGSDTQTRKIIGYTLETQNNSYCQDIADRYFLEIEWAEILKEAKNNQVLQDAIDRVKILYHLSKQDEQRDCT